MLEDSGMGSCSDWSTRWMALAVRGQSENALSAPHSCSGSELTVGTG